MEKNAIKNYAIYARNKLRQSTIDMASIIGITEKGIQEPVSKGSNFEIYKSTIGTETILDATKIEQRNNLIKQIKEKGFEQVIEEVAYTWFNRLIAIRFMEVNDYLPSRTRVLSSETEGKAESDLMTDPFNAGFNFSNQQKELILDYKDNNNTDELFKLLFIAQCNELSKILPGLFEGTDEYTELLFNIKYNDKEDVVYKLVNDIPESNFNVEQEGQIEIIGWMYQFYNTDKNELVYTGSMSKSRITKELLPAATTIYTPDWVVKYMVENSLGKFYLDGHSESALQTKWKYYLEEAEQERSVKKELEKIKEEHRIPLEEIKLIDPCMGSGHILVYAFDVFMQMYVEQGWSERDASISILENNIFGLDIDKRAYQLSYFALLMKARQYNKRLFRKEIKINLYEIVESNGITTTPLHDMGINLSEDEYKKAVDQCITLVKTFKDAKEYGSILKVQSLDWTLLRKFANPRLDENGQGTLDLHGEVVVSEKIQSLINIAEVLSMKYEAVVTNPPYLSSSRFSEKLLKYVNDEFNDVKADLSMVMYKHALCSLSQINGYVSFITTSSWMFLSGFEKLRKYLLNNYSIDTLVDFGSELFEGKVGHNLIVSWVTRHNRLRENGTYIRLVDYCYSNRDKKEPEFFNRQNWYYSSFSNFNKIPGKLVAYWISNKAIDWCENHSLKNDVIGTVGIQTGDNEKFIRLWTEVNVKSIKFTAGSYLDSFSYEKWYKYNKGGDYRKWCGNDYYVVHWQNDGEFLKNDNKVTGHHCQEYRNELKFAPFVTWSRITSGKPSFRIKKCGYLSDMAGFSIFTQSLEMNNLIAFCNSKVAEYYLSFMAPTLNIMIGNVLSLPYDNNMQQDCEVSNISDNCIRISKTDWNSYETSWDFTAHPMVRGLNCVESSYLEWKSECNSRFDQLKANEEELNKIFIDIYGLNDELDPYVEDKDVTVHYVVDKKEDASFSSNYVRTREDEIKSLISYAVGCMFGRYSLDVEGLAYAGGEFDSSKYSSFIPDTDNIIPIREESYFEEDDIVDRFVEFIRVAYGEATLEENLKFIADSLSNKGTTSRDVIRNYFINDFFKDHCATYQVTGSGKRPIYWLFDSGKQNGFKALIYMHRYNEDTVSNVRTDYLHKVQSIYEQGIKDDTYTIENATRKADITKARKHRDKLEKQLAETRIYDQALAHIANERISIDLDDGVKVNYAKFQGVEVINEGSKKIKVDLLAKIK